MLRLRAQPEGTGALDGLGLIVSGANTATIATDQSSDFTTKYPAVWPSRASAAGPCVSVRTALTITVIGWFSAKPCSHEGIDATGTYALDTNVSGKTMKARPCAACAVPANMPSEMNTHSNAKP